MLDEDISEYITGIIEDESMEEDEKREVISEFLSEATVSVHKKKRETPTRYKKTA